MTTSIEFAKAVTEFNLKRDMDRIFSSSEAANIQHTNATIRQAVRQHAVSYAKRTRYTSMQATLDAEGDALLQAAKSHAQQCSRCLALSGR